MKYSTRPRVGHLGNDWSRDYKLVNKKNTKQAALKKATQSLIVSKTYSSKQKNEDACSGRIWNSLRKADKC